MIGLTLEYWNPPYFESLSNDHISVNKNGMIVIIAKRDLIIQKWTQIHQPELCFNSTTMYNNWDSAHANKYFVQFSIILFGNCTQSCV